MIELIPAIDIIDGKCVRLSQGDYASKKVYNEDPLEVAKMFEDNGLKRLHVVDLDGAKAQHIVNYRALETLASHTSLTIDFGGGLKSDEDLKIAFDSGAQMVTGGSIAVKQPLVFEGWLARYGADRNGDGAVVVELNVYTWSADASLTDMNSQMAGATRMNTDLANGTSGIWVLEDPAGFEAAYGALSETLGADWADQLVAWGDVPALAGADLGSYDTAADGSASQSVQELLAPCKIAVLDASDGLWAALTAGEG